MSTPQQRPPSGPVPRGPGAGPGRPTPGPRAEDPEAAAAARRASLTFVLLVLASLFSLALPLPWQLATVAFTVGTVVMGIRALLATRRAGGSSNLGPMLVVGIALSVMMSMSVLSSAVVYDLSVARQECLARALTTSATAACEKDFRESVEQRLQDLRERAGAAG